MARQVLHWSKGCFAPAHLQSCLPRAHVFIYRLPFVYCLAQVIWPDKLWLLVGRVAHARGMLSVPAQLWLVLWQGGKRSPKFKRTDASQAKHQSSFESLASIALQKRDASVPRRLLCGQDVHISGSKWAPMLETGSVSLSAMDEVKVRAHLSHMRRTMPSGLATRSAESTTSNSGDLGVLFFSMKSYSVLTCSTPSSSGLKPSKPVGEPGCTSFHQLGPDFSGSRMRKQCWMQGSSSFSVGMTVGLPSFSKDGSGGPQSECFLLCKWMG